MRALSNQHVRVDQPHLEATLRTSTLVAHEDDTWNCSASYVSQKSWVLEQAFDRYLEMSEDGEFDLDSLLAEFPDYQHSLINMIRVRQYMDNALGTAGDADAAPAVWPAVGERFLDFELHLELGRGALSRVFLASQLSMGDRVVVVKLATWGEDEASIMGPLQHENIVEVHSHHRDPSTGLTALCMPLEGIATLADVLDYAAAAPGRLCSDTILDASRLAGSGPPAELAPNAPVGGAANIAGAADQPDSALQGQPYVAGVVRLGSQLAEALAYTHRRGIIHRDIKPSNVLMTISGRPLLMDFNLSSDRTLQRQRVGGTLPYMAPERISELFLDAPPHQQPESSDVFSLGVLLYELIAGHLPFGAPDPTLPPAQAAAELLRRHQQRPRMLGPRWRDAPPQLRRLLQSCLAADPSERPVSAQSLAAQLRCALESPPKRPWRQPAMLVVVLLVCATLFSSFGAHSGARNGRPPVSIHALEGLRAVKRKAYDAAATSFQAAYKRMDQDPLCLAWRFYCGLAAEQSSEDLLAVYEQLAAAGYAGPELQSNYAALLSVCPGMDPQWVAAELDRAVAERPDAIGPRVSRARYCSKKRTTLDAQDFGCSDILTAVHMAGSQADVTLHFLAARIVARSMQLRAGELPPDEIPEGLELVHEHFRRSAELGLHRDGALVIASNWDLIDQQPWYHEIRQNLRTVGRHSIRDREWMLVVPADPTN